MKVAIVHEMLIKLGGAERVVLDLLELFPDADIFTLLHDEKRVSDWFPKDTVTVAKPAQRMFQVLRKPRACLPWMRKAVESLNLTGYDLVISSSSGFAHGCITDPDTKHICYYHSPARYLWDATHEVQREIGMAPESTSFLATLKRLMFGSLLSRLRTWDTEASSRPDVVIANSQEVATRIKKYYRKDADRVIYPGVDTSRFEPGDARLGERTYYVTGGAFTPFKRHDLTIQMCTELGINLKIFGTGPQEDYLKELAGPTIDFVGRVSDEEQVELYRHARGFLMSNKEDFGITPIEAMAAGLPVFAYGKGGVLETVTSAVGMLFDDQEIDLMKEVFTKFDHMVSDGAYTQGNLTNHAKSFSREVFLESFTKAM